MCSPPWTTSWPRSAPTSPSSARARQLARLVKPGRARDDEALLISLLAGFPDRVARRRRPGEPEILLAAGGSAELAPASVVRDAQLMVAVDVEERRTGASRKAIARAASAIEPEWLIDLFPDALREERQAEWNAAGERVEIASRLRYDGLVLDETRGPPGPPTRKPPPPSSPAPPSPAAPRRWPRAWNASSPAPASWPRRCPSSASRRPTRRRSAPPSSTSAAAPPRCPTSTAASS
jgi:hypothetical protein